MSLLKLRGKIKEFKISSLDVETKNNEFFYGIIYHNNKFLEFYDPKRLSLFLQKKVYDNYYLCGFNLAYDLNSLHPHFKLNRLENLGRFITIKRDKDRNKYFRFIDLSNFFYQGIKLIDVCKSYNLEYIDVHDYNNPLIYEACRNHAYVSAKILEKIQNKINSLGGNLKLTIGATALDLFRRKYLKEDQNINKNCLPDIVNEHKIFQSMAYKGGWVEMFKRGEFKDVVCIDVNSLYPFIMKDLTVPNINKISDVIYNSHYENFLNNNEGIANLDIKINKNINIHPFLIKHDNKLIAFNDKFTDTFTFLEIRKMLEMKKVKILKCNWFITAPPVFNYFTDYINDLFKFKKSDATGIYKLLLNSLYGKYGQKDDKNYYEFIEEIKNNDNIDINDYDVLMEDEFVLDNVKYKFVSNSKDIVKFNKKAYPIISAYVTAAGRLYLYNAMEKIGFDKILYCDTDSLVINDCEENIRQKINISKELGDWSIKFKGSFEARGLKYYKFNDEYVIKNVPKNKMKEFWDNGFCYITKPIKYRNAIRNNLKLNEWTTFKLESKNNTFKRNFYNNIDSKLFSIKEYNKSTYKI